MMTNPNENPSPSLPSGLRPILEGMLDNTKKINDILLRARASGKTPGVKDNKFYCAVDDISTLLKVNAQAILLNGSHGSAERPYIHRVSYEGIEFVTTSEKRVQEFDDYLARKPAK
jgi:hypothetical protein